MCYAMTHELLAQYYHARLLTYNIHYLLQIVNFVNSIVVLQTIPEGCPRAVLRIFDVTVNNDINNSGKARLHEHVL